MPSDTHHADSVVSPPRARVDANGEPVDNGPELDLAEKDDTGSYRHSIVRLIDNTEHRFDTSRYFS